MNKLYYQFPGTWFGDCMPFGKGNTFFLFHQRDTRQPEPFGQPFGWSLATTEDFVHYQDCGTAIPRGSDDEQDQFIYAGSVFHGEGQYHAFYTGYNKDYPAAGKASQVLMHAVSDDLYHWSKSHESLKLSPQEGYDADEWRDPMVIRDEDHKRYLLILGARKKGPKTAQTGRTVKFTSDDLEHWKFEGDFWAPDLFTMHEMPDLFKMGDWWYHIVTEYSNKHGMIYRMSRSLDGPWLTPYDDAFDGSAYYAGRTFALNGHRVLFGWVPTKTDDDDTHNYEWGGTFVPHELYQRSDGSLGAKPLDSIRDAFNPAQNINETYLRGDGKRVAKTLSPSCGDIFSFETDAEFSDGTRTFGFRLYADEETGQSYQFAFHAQQDFLRFEANPNYPWFNYMNIGMERPLRLEPNEPNHIQIIVDDTIMTIYVNGVALNARVYRHFGDSLEVFVTDGALKLSNTRIARGLKKERDNK